MSKSKKNKGFVPKKQTSTFDFSSLLTYCSQDEILKFKEGLKGKAVSSLILNPLIYTAKRLEEEFKKIAFQNTAIPVYMNVDGKPITDGTAVPALLVKQAMSPVRWVQTLENMQADGIDTFIECGAGKTLSGLVKKTLKGVKILRVENLKTLQSTLEELKA
jgi:malonyl CoA-acyl carrier protein transacylase